MAAEADHRDHHQHRRQPSTPCARPCARRWPAARPRRCRARAGSCWWQAGCTLCSRGWCLGDEMAEGVVVILLVVLAAPSEGEGAAAAAAAGARAERESDGAKPSRTRRLRTSQPQPFSRRRHARHAGHRDEAACAGALGWTCSSSSWSGSGRRRARSACASAGSLSPWRRRPRASTAQRAGTGASRAPTTASRAR